MGRQVQRRLGLGRVLSAGGGKAFQGLPVKQERDDRFSEGPAEERKAA